MALKMSWMASRGGLGEIKLEMKRLTMTPKKQAIIPPLPSPRGNYQQNFEKGGLHSKVKNFLRATLVPYFPFI
jgi:hypothetical protein